VYASFISPMRTTRSSHFTLLMSGEEYKFWSASLCNFLYPLLTSLLGSNIFFSILFSNNHNSYLFFELHENSLILYLTLDRFIMWKLVAL
jgi:hypothetical protein